jgi:predicted phosphate transport protein (TIGR00153 family)
MRLLPRTEEFFDLFTEVARRSHEAAGYQRELFTNPERLSYCVDTIKRLEHEADEITQDVSTRLDRTFITPIDREDIYLLASDLDDVMDRIDSTARRAQIFRLGAPPDGIIQMCDLAIAATGELEAAVKKLRGKNDMMGHRIEVKRIEEEADAVFHEMLGRLFDTETDPIAIIKWKEMFDKIETTIDKTNDVAGDLESIALKHG